MITASSDFITAVNQTSRQFRARFIVNSSPLDCDIKNVRCYKGSCGSEMALGCVYAPYIEATLLRCSDNLDGVELTYQIGLLTGSDYEYIDIGAFKVLDSKTGNGSMTFTAIGTLAQIGNNEYVSALNYPSTISAVTNELSSVVYAATGKTISFKGFPAANLNGQIPYAIAGPVREALSTIAALLGGFVSEDNAGNIVIAKYKCGGTLSIEPYRSLEIPEVRETPFQTLGVHVTVSDATEDEEGQPVPEVYYEYGTPVIYQKVPWMTQSVFNAMVLQFCGLTFDLSTFEISLGDPRIEPWDVISLEDLAGDTHSISPFSLVHVFDGGLATQIEAEVTSTGASGSNVKGALQKYVERLDSEVFAAATAAVQAKKSAEDAEAALEIIREDVDVANGLLEDMEEAAEQAGTTLTGIYQDAADAQRSANDAQTSANEANASAAGALLGLAQVEDVVGTLTWFTEHITPTTDTEVYSDKTYYSYDGVGYTVVEAPTGNPSAQGWYEIDESIKNFIASHLSQTNYGLNLLLDNTSYRIHIGTLTENGEDGVYILNEYGDIVSFYGEGIRLGDSIEITAGATPNVRIGLADGFHIVVTSSDTENKIGFYENLNTEVAYISNEKLHINAAELQTVDGRAPTFRMGNFLWMVRSVTNPDDRLTLRYAPESSE